MLALLTVALAASASAVPGFMDDLVDHLEDSYDQFQVGTKSLLNKTVQINVPILQI